MSEKPIITVYKVINISSAHKLCLPYESKCNQIHGHNWKIETWLTGKLNESKMVVDFTMIKKEVLKLDHTNINNFVEPSTAENIAIYLAQRLFQLEPTNLIRVRVRVWETETSYAEYDYVPSSQK